MDQSLASEEKNMELNTLTTEELAEHLNAVLAEQERRQALATIPAQIADLTARYVAGGGDPSDLTPEAP
jgi:hypothetical protein